MSEAYRLRHSRSNENYGANRTENISVLNVLCVFISLITILADLTTDILLFAEYCRDGYLYWGCATWIFIATPNILINIFSMRWFIADQRTDRKDCLLHVSLTGLLQRYVLFLQNVFTCKGLEVVQSQKLTSQRNDLSLLHFLYVFTGTIPQIILQAYSILILDGNSNTKVLALIASNVSVFWGCATYIFSIMNMTSVKFQWISLILRLLWHFSMLVARVWGVLLFTIHFGVWVLLPLGVHWAAMTFWIIVQNTSFCHNKLEETLYNVVMGFVYCFCYINLREGHTRYRLVLFYTLMITQNFGSLLLYIFTTDTSYHGKPWCTSATVCIIAGTISGICAMIFYYRYFHSKGPITWRNANKDVELNNKISSQNDNDGLQSVRSFKCIEKERCGDPRYNPENEIKTRSQTIVDNDKNLNENWSKISESLASIPSQCYDMDTRRVDYNNSKHFQTDKSYLTKKQVTVCSPTELTLKMASIENVESSIDEITTISLNIKKRRGIYSSHIELCDDLNNISLDMCEKGKELSNETNNNLGSVTSHETEGSNKKQSSDSIDMDLDLSLSDINSSDINTYNENIVQKLCLSALKNIKVGNQDADIENIQKIAVDILKEMYDKKGTHQCMSDTNSVMSKQRDLDTPTEQLSVHDYENICAVNIAREAWGLRSWNGYTDIENWLHDGSVVRDRRRDTLTSASTEVSSCISHELKNAMMSLPSFPKRPPTYSNVYVKCDRNFDDYVNTAHCNLSDETFLAKPCMAEGKEMNILEPIIEELDDLGDIDPSLKKKLNSESSLVATIDKIRKTTAFNSPKNIQQRCLLPDQSRYASSNLDNNLKKALWKEPSKFIKSNTMKSLPVKDNVLPVQNHKLEYNQNPNYCTMSPSQQSIQNAKISKKRQKKLNNVKSQPTICNDKNYHNEHEFSSKNIDLLWQLVNENSTQSNALENLTKPNKVSTSLQSLIQNDTSLAKTSSAKKNLKSRPRRKFSILRERFEPKMISHSDEEEIYQRYKGKINAGFVDKIHSQSKESINQHWDSSFGN